MVTLGKMIRLLHLSPFLVALSISLFSIPTSADIYRLNKVTVPDLNLKSLYMYSKDDAPSGDTYPYIQLKLSLSLLSSGEKFVEDQFVQVAVVKYESNDLFVKNANGKVVSVVFVSCCYSVSVLSL